MAGDPPRPPRAAVNLGSSEQLRLQAAGEVVAVRARSPRAVGTAGAAFVLLLLVACSPPPPPACVALEVTIRIPPGIAPPSTTGARLPGVRTAAPPPYRLTAEGRGARVLEGLEPGGAPAVFCLEPGEWQLVLEAGTAVPSRAIAEVVRPGPLQLVIPPPTLP